VVLGVGFVLFIVVVMGVFVVFGFVNGVFNILMLIFVFICVFDC